MTGCVSGQLSVATELTKTCNITAGMWNITHILVTTQLYLSRLRSVLVIFLSQPPECNAFEIVGIMVMQYKRFVGCFRLFRHRHIIVFATISTFVENYENGFISTILFISTMLCRGYKCAVY